MEDEVTINLSGPTAKLVSDTLRHAGEIQLQGLDRWRSRLVDIDWDPEEEWITAVKLLSASVQVGAQLATSGASTTLDPILQAVLHARYEQWRDGGPLGTVPAAPVFGANQCEYVGDTAAGPRRCVKPAGHYDSHALVGVVS